jgi:hypothetical protein
LAGRVSAGGVSASLAVHQFHHALPKTMDGLQQCGLQPDPQRALSKSPVTPPVTRKMNLLLTTEDDGNACWICSDEHLAGCCLLGLEMPIVKQSVANKAYAQSTRKQRSTLQTLSATNVLTGSATPSKS